MWQLVYVVMTFIVWAVLAGCFVQGLVLLREDNRTGLLSPIPLFVIGGLVSIGAVDLIVVWVLWLVKKGHQGANKYWSDPRQFQL